MSYLILSDFKKLIQTDNLSAIIGSDFSILDQIKQAAQTEVTSYLTQKYDCSREFADTLIWIFGTAYKANQRVYLDAPAYSAASTYALNTLTLQNSNVYICSTAITIPEAFTIGHWTLLGTQYAMFYVTLPQPEFNLNKVYSVGDIVWYKDKVYTALLPTLLLNHSTQLQYGEYNQLPSNNIFPDDSIQGLKYWGTGTSFALTAGTLPTAIGWTVGDNRNAQLVNYCIDVALYTAHSRIAPRNIPELRVKRYDDVIKWLKSAATGKDITAALPMIQPVQGMRIRWGSEIRKQNNY